MNLSFHPSLYFKIGKQENESMKDEFFIQWIFAGGKTISVTRLRAKRRKRKNETHRRIGLKQNSELSFCIQVSIATHRNESLIHSGNTSVQIE